MGSQQLLLRAAFVGVLAVSVVACNHTPVKHSYPGGYRKNSTMGGRPPLVEKAIAEETSAPESMQLAKRRALPSDSQKRHSVEKTQSKPETNSAQQQLLSSPTPGVLLGELSKRPQSNAVYSRRVREETTPAKVLSEPQKNASQRLPVATRSPAPKVKAPVIAADTNGARPLQTPKSTSQSERLRNTKKLAVDKTLAASSVNSASKLSVKTVPKKVKSEAENINNRTKNVLSMLPNLDSLPLTIADQWQLNTNGADCHLQSRGLNMADGQGGTPVTLVVSSNAVSFVTRSNVDLSYDGTGISIDGSVYLPLEAVDSDTVLVIRNQKEKLLTAMSKGNTMKLVVGFWPTWPRTRTYSLTVPLNSFSNAMRAWQRCNDLLDNQQERG